MTPTVSIVIPAFNRERFIASAIDSALGQTVAADQIIVVDDGSTDRTGEIARSYGASVRVISIENNGAGPSRPRNVGIQAATSSHIMFLDSDDLLEPIAVERCSDVVKRFPQVGLVCGNYCTVTDGPDMQRRRGANEFSTVRQMSNRLVGQDEYYVERDTAYLAYCQYNFIKTNATTVPRHICLDVGGFDETLRTSNDYDFFIRVLARYDMVYIQQTLHTIVYHNDNISAANMDQKFREYVFIDHLRVLRRELQHTPDSKCRTAIQSSIASWLFGMAYGYRTSGQTARSLRTYAEYIAQGGAIWPGVRGMAGSLAYGLAWTIKRPRRELNGSVEKSSSSA